MCFKIVIYAIKKKKNNNNKNRTTVKNAREE